MWFLHDEAPFHYSGSVLYHLVIVFQIGGYEQMDQLADLLGLLDFFYGVETKDQIYYRSKNRGD